MRTVLILVAVLLLNNLKAQESKELVEIVVEITNVKSTDGTIKVALYQTEKSFLKKGVKLGSCDIDGTTARFVFKGVKSGVYAISCYHDENSNDKLDTNFFGIPKEPVCTSNNAVGKYGPPKWIDAKFNVDYSNVTQNIKF